MPMHGAPLFGRGLSVDLTVSRRTDVNVELDDVELSGTVRESRTVRTSGATRASEPTTARSARDAWTVRRKN